MYLSVMRVPLTQQLFEAVDQLTRVDVGRSGLDSTEHRQGTQQRHAPQSRLHFQILVVVVGVDSD